MNVGIDIIQNNRIKLKNKFINKVLGSKELEIFNNIEIQNRKIEFLAGRWAAKEALFKSSKKDIIFNNWNIILENNEIKVYENNEIKNNIKISISHEKDYSVAICIIN